MKIHEVLSEAGLLKNIGQSVAQSVKRSGILGKGKQMQAFRQDVEKDRQAAYSDAQQAVKNRFLSDFKAAVEGAARSGLIDFTPPAAQTTPPATTAAQAAPAPTPTPEGRITIMSMLKESISLMEGVSVEQFVQKYMKNLLKNYGQLEPEYQKSIDALTDEFSKKYTSARSPFPMDVAEKIWGIAWAIKNSHTKQDGVSQSVEPPDEDVDFANAFEPGTSTQWKYTFDKLSNTWTRYPRNATTPSTPGTQIDDKSSLFKKINAAYSKHL